MQKFSAQAFFDIGQFLTHVRRNADDLIQKEGNSRETLLGQASRGSKTSTQSIEFIRKNCEDIGLTLSLKAVNRLSDLRQANGTTIGDVMDAVHHLQTTIADEVDDKVFMFMPSDRAVYYDQQELLGREVSTKFPGIQFDIVEAGNCYATGRGTATVFHLMRIMETGVQAFGTKLGVALADEKNWQNILDEVNKAIKALPPKDPATVKMSQASANLYAVKLAWRNEVMHPKDTYTLEEADNLIRQVKIFMEQLATIV
jgi:hypothetical protein